MKKTEFLHKTESKPRHAKRRYFKHQIILNLYTFLKTLIFQLTVWHPRARFILPYATHNLLWIEKDRIKRLVWFNTEYFNFWHDFVRYEIQLCRAIITNYTVVVTSNLSQTNQHCLYNIKTTLFCSATWYCGLLYRRHFSRTFPQTLITTLKPTWECNKIVPSSWVSTRALIPRCTMSPAVWSEIVTVSHW